MSSPSISKLFPLALLATATLAAPSRRDAWHMGDEPKAVYFMTNGANNAIIALPVAQDGTLSQGTTTMTGGKGSVAVDASGKPATGDGLSSQGSVVVKGNMLFAVNAGSNTLSMFSIDPDCPTELRLVGQPAAIPGDFPNTVAASLKDGLVCVATTGARAGISCASFSPSGLGQMDTLREFDLHQTTPPSAPPNTVSDTFFSSDHSTLLTTVKGVPMTNNNGFLSAFQVQRDNHGKASLGRTDVQSSLAGTKLLFGAASIPGSNSIIVSDPSFGAAILSLDQRGQATVAHSQNITGQMATCWAVVSKKTRSAFVTDGGIDRLVELSVEDGSVLSETDLSATGDLGLIDLESGGNFIYALAPNNASTVPAISVVDVSGGQKSAKLVQHFQLGGMNSLVQGMAVFH